MPQLRGEWTNGSDLRPNFNVRFNLGWKTSEYVFKIGVVGSIQINERNAKRFKQAH